MGGYEYLMSNYHPGDKVCLFGRECAVSIRLAANLDPGFSRGAYAARALAGMLHKVIRVARNVVHDV